MAEKTIKMDLRDLRKRAEQRKVANAGKVHPAQDNNEFFLTVKDNIYSQITKENS